VAADHPGDVADRHALARWITEAGQPDLPGILRDAIEELRAVLAPSDRLGTVPGTAGL